MKNMNKRGALEPDKYLIGLLIFSVVMIVGMMMVQDINENYDNVNILQDDFESSSNITSNVYNLSQDIKESIYDKDIDETDSPSSMFSGAYKALRFFAGSFALVGGLLSTAVKIELLPAVFLYPFLTIVTILVIISVVYMVFRFQPRS